AVRSRRATSPPILSLSLHDALPIFIGGLTTATVLTLFVVPALCLIAERRQPDQRPPMAPGGAPPGSGSPGDGPSAGSAPGSGLRSEEHTSELQSRENLVCRLLLEKK